jgi:hypothetical protein
MGKRHMGELNFGQTHASASLWDLENAVDLTQWRWTPPTSFEVRQNSQRGDVRPSLLENLATWVFPPGSHVEVEPSGTITGRPNSSWAVSMEAAAEAPAVRPEPVCVGHRAPTPPLRRMSSDVLDLRLASRDAEELVDICLQSLRGNDSFVKFRNRLRAIVAEAQISTDALQEFLVHIDRKLRKERFTPCRVALWSNQLYFCVLAGLSLSRKTYGTSFATYEGIYRMLLYNISTLDGSTVALFHQILAEIPQESIFRFKHAIMTYMTEFISTCSRPHNALSPKDEWHVNTLQQVDYMASGLQDWDTNIPRHGQMLDKIAAAIVSQKRNPNLRPHDHQQMRYAWLHLVARLPKVGYEFFVATWRKLELDPSTDAFTEKQVCAIFLARLQTDGLVKDASDMNRKIQTAHYSRCYSIIASELWRAGQQHCVKMLAILFRHSGRDKDLFHLAWAIQQAANNEATPLANLALGLGHPELALWTHIRCHQTLQWTGGFWSTSSAVEILSTVINHHHMRVNKVLDALNIHPSPYPTSPSKDDIQRAQVVACAIARSRCLSDTEAFTYITRCIKYLQSHLASLPPGILHALFLVVTRDFASGRPGRAARLRWFLKLLLRETNEERVLEVGLGLKRWRTRIIRMRKAVHSRLSYGSAHRF